MRFVVFVPVLNAGPKIARTIHSILAQHSVRTGENEVRCILLDAASTDDTVAQARRAGGDKIEIISEPDRGMYPALARHLGHADGDVVSILAAGEVYEASAFAVVSEVLTAFPRIEWLTGRATIRNSMAQIVDAWLPHPYRRRFFATGQYGTAFPPVQQESTFWRTGMLAHLDLPKLGSIPWAGDYFMWKCFAKAAELYVVNAELGSWTFEDGQLSRRVPGAYRSDLLALRDPPGLAERLIVRVLSRLLKRRIPGRRAKRLIRYDLTGGRWTMPRPD